MDWILSVNVGEELLPVSCEKDSCVCYLTLGALQVAGDTGMFGPVQHGADLLTQFQGGGSDQTWRLPSNPYEDVRPAVQDVNALCVEQRLQLK